MLKNKYYNVYLNKIIGLTIYCLFVIVCVFFIVYNATWTIGDQMQFLPLIKGHRISGFINPTMGRFMPLVFEDYNILWVISKMQIKIDEWVGICIFTNVLESQISVYSCYVINIIGFVALSIFLYLTLTKFVDKNSVFGVWEVVLSSMLFLLYSYKVQINTIYSERIMSLMIMIFIYFCIKFFETDKWYYALISLLAAVYSTYCKEPFFGCLIVFCVTILIYDRKLSKNGKVYIYLLLFNAVLFLILYCVCVLPQIQSAYNNDMRDGASKLSVLIKTICEQKLLVLFVPIVFFRMYKLLVQKDIANILFDALLFGGASYAVACYILVLDGDYYLIPAFAMMIPPVAYYLNKYVKSYISIIILLICCIYYLFVDYREVKQSQKIRVDTIERTSMLIDVCNNDKCIYFEPFDREESSTNWNEHVYWYFRNILKSYIAVRTGNFDFDYCETKPTSDFVNIKYCISNFKEEEAMSAYCVEYN